MLEILLIRHGESIANASGVVQGHLDSMLSTRGLDQVAQLGRYLHEVPLDAVYHSDLDRAHATARAVHGDREVPLVADPRLREHDVGLCTGLTWAQFRERHPAHFEALSRARTWEVVPGAESDEAVIDRARAFLADLRRAHPAGRVAIVSHGGFIRRLLAELLGPVAFHLDFDNASITEVHVAPGVEPALAYLNRIPYAPGPRPASTVLEAAPLDRV